MRNARSVGILGVLCLVLLVPAARAQSHDVYWHTSPDVESCSMVIDPSLTQPQWRRFTREAGAIVSFKALQTAHTLGKGHFAIMVDNSRTPVDQHDPAWINTFTHPNDRNCPLGDEISIPTVRARVGVAENVDLGGAWTTAPKANYGLVGADVKYAFLQRPGRWPAAAVRAGVTILTGVPDFNMAIYSVDLMSSRRVAFLTPYLGIKESLSVGTETTSKVDLDGEKAAITQGYAGVVYSVWKVQVAAQYEVSFVNTLAMAVGVGF